MKAANLALRFLLEVSALVALGYWGFHVGSSEPLHWVLGIGAPLVAAVVWGLFIAPRATVNVSNTVWIVLQILVFGSAVAALVAAGISTLAIVFAAALAVNAALMIVWKQGRNETDLR